VARWPEAIWQPVPQHGGALSPIAVTLHHQAGLGNPAPVYAARDVSAHFWLPYSGQPVQHVDTNVQAWHGIQHNAYSIGVETEGCQNPPNADPLNDHQLTMFGKLMAWASATHGIPLVLSDTVTTPGLNYHNCRGGPTTSCPCDVRRNARSEILSRAGGATPTPTPPTPPTTTTPPPLHVDYFGPAYGHNYTVADVATWQRQMVARGWSLDVDSVYGPASQRICEQFQQEKHLTVDGLVGPQTWDTTWTAPIT
jgi:peptidoglycan hydrolase-like protein with peptidoglycan-binding domain